MVFLHHGPISEFKRSGYQNITEEQIIDIEELAKRLDPNSTHEDGVSSYPRESMIPKGQKIDPQDPPIWLIHFWDSQTQDGLTAKRMGFRALRTADENGDMMYVIPM
jgi:hypothetical protein